MFSCSKWPSLYGNASHQSSVHIHTQAKSHILHLIYLVGWLLVRVCAIASSQTSIAMAATKFWDARFESLYGLAYHVGADAKGLDAHLGRLLEGADGADVRVGGVAGSELARAGGGPARRGVIGEGERPGQEGWQREHRGRRG